MNRIKLWVYFNSKKRTLPISFSKNTTFYITAMIADMGEKMEDFIKQMKKLIDYLGKENVMVQIVENGDSQDNTRDYLKLFQYYLKEKKIINNFLLNHEVEDPRKKIIPFQKCGPLRIEFYANLRNRCFDLLYSIPNLDYNNIKVIYFNDIIFEYENIINLIANNEDYDAVCAMDFADFFSERWVSIDLDGNSFKKKIFHILKIKKDKT